MTKVLIAAIAIVGIYLLADLLPAIIRFCNLA